MGDLDARVTEHVMQARWSIRNAQCYRFYASPVAGWFPWSPSTDLAASWEVVEALRERGVQVRIADQTDPDPWVVTFTAQDETESTRARETLPLAICCAALASVGAEVPA